MPAVQFLMLTVYEDSDSLFNSLKAGASGYLLKRTAAARLIDAIRDVHTGGSPMTPQLARRVVQHFSRATEGGKAVSKQRRASGIFSSNSPTATRTRKSSTA